MWNCTLPHVSRYTDGCHRVPAAFSGGSYNGLRMPGCLSSHSSRARTQRRTFGTRPPGKQKLTIFLSSHEKASYPAPGYHHLPRYLPRITAENPPSCRKMERLKDLKKWPVGHCTESCTGASERMVEPTPFHWCTWMSFLSQPQLGPTTGVAPRLDRAEQ